MCLYQFKLREDSDHAVHTPLKIYNGPPNDFSIDEKAIHF